VIHLSGGSPCAEFWSSRQPQTVQHQLMLSLVILSDVLQTLMLDALRSPCGPVLAGCPISSRQALQGCITVSSNFLQMLARSGKDNRLTGPVEVDVPAFIHDFFALFFYSDSQKPPDIFCGYSGRAANNTEGKMDALQRLRRVLPAQVSDRLTFLMPTRVQDTHATYPGWRDLPKASAADRVVFAAILGGFVIMIVPALIFAAIAMLIMRLVSFIGKNSANVG
jgi:hypothetical protein